MKNTQKEPQGSNSQRLQQDRANQPQQATKRTENQASLKQDSRMDESETATPKKQPAKDEKTGKK